MDQMIYQPFSVHSACEALATDLIDATSLIAVLCVLLTLSVLVVEVHGSCLWMTSFDAKVEPTSALIRVVTPLH